MSIPPQSQNADKRAEKRATLDQHVTILINNQPLPARFINISITGMGLLCPEMIEPNTAVSTQVTLTVNHQPTTLNLQGKAFHATAVHDHFLIGIVLCGLTPYRQRIIEQYIALND